MKRFHSGARSTRARLTAGAALVTLSLFASAAAMADARTQAKRMHDRLAGVPPRKRADTDGGADPFQPARRCAIAMQAPSFYTATLKNWVTPWTNREQTVFAPLNDYSATVIGMIRDNEPFNTVLSADILYVGGTGLPAYSPTSNALYEQLENEDRDLSNVNVLVKSTQSAHNGLPGTATAGVMTPALPPVVLRRGYNRAMFRFTLMAHMCKDLEQVNDVHLRPIASGRISRARRAATAGSSEQLRRLSQRHGSARAGLAYTTTTKRWPHRLYPGVVQPKYLINMDNFKPGYVTATTAGRTTGGMVPIACWGGAARCRAAVMARVDGTGTGQQ